MGRETDSLQLLAPLLLTGGKGADLVIRGNVVLNNDNDVLDVSLTLAHWLGRANIIAISYPRSDGTRAAAAVWSVVRAHGAGAPRLKAQRPMGCRSCPDRFLSCWGWRTPVLCVCLPS
jgi:hypothetical protein